MQKKGDARRKGAAQSFMEKTNYKGVARIRPSNRPDAVHIYVVGRVPKTAEGSSARSGMSKKKRHSRPRSTVKSHATTTSDRAIEHRIQLPVDY
jgi:hypothetical protein